jgi:16S rRNA (cytidine1402-2'-O)-methyltransferase
MGRLYLVSTPIGNREDISLRALKTLFSVDFILTEDTRSSGKLLSLYSEKLLAAVGCDSKKPQLISYYEGNEQKRLSFVLKLLKNGQNVALVSDAGTPLISDPGFRLVRECLLQDIGVEAIPGASALLTALVSSGLPPDKFLFLGFLPKKEVKKTKFLKKVLEIKSTLSMTVVAYESPFRIIKTINLLDKLDPTLYLVVERELTKKFEQRMAGNPSELLNELKKEKKIKGELVLLF